MHRLSKLPLKDFAMDFFTKTRYLKSYLVIPVVPNHASGKLLQLIVPLENCRELQAFAPENSRKEVEGGMEVEGEQVIKT